MLYFIAAFYGLLIGNYTTTAYFRIPKSIAINGLNNKVGKAPHCSVCGHKLKFYEYLPLLSWISTGFSCNYCNASINPVYTILEVSVMLSSIILFYLLGMNILYIVAVLLSSALALNIALFYSHRKFYSKAVYFAIIMMIIYILS